MKELYNEFFYIPKHGKVKEKVMLVRTAITVIIMIVCLAVMSITAYAYFSYNVTSGSNIIKAANFEANAAIYRTDSNHKTLTVTSPGRIQTANLTAGTYAVELTKGESSAQTGFCIITIDGADYYTSQIGVDAEKGLSEASIKFTLKVSSDTKLEIRSHWGTSAYYGYADASSNSLYIENEDIIDLTASTIDIDETSPTEGQGAASETVTPESTTPTTESTISTESASTATTESTTAPSTETTIPAETIAPESTETSEPADTTEPTIPETINTEAVEQTQPATENASTEQTHIGEVQTSLWDEETLRICKENNIPLP